MTHNLFAFNVAGLSPVYLKYLENLPAFSHLLKNGQKTSLKPVFPCLTIPCQMSLATGTYPCQHGMIANGLFHRDRLEVSFWDQYRSLLLAEPFWETLKREKPELKTAVLFWQNTLYAHADIIITPRPIHADHEMIQWCYSKPVGLYEDIAQKITPFDLMHYWGPLASAESSRWIMNAAITVLRDHHPNVMLTYLPHLDYSTQRYGPDAPEVMEDLKVLDELMGDFLDELDRMGMTENSVVAVFSEYSLSQVSGAICPNILLRQAGFLDVREINGREYLDIEMSRAFAMVDHQVAHIYVKKHYEEDVMELLKKVDGIQMILTEELQKEYKINHERSGELLAVTQPDRWFAYYWWESPEKAPDFAHHMDIHRKPGFDPLELFFDFENMIIPTDTSLIKGSHGVPCKEDERMALLLLNGRNLKDLHMASTIEMVEVAPLLTDILREEE